MLLSIASAQVLDFAIAAIVMMSAVLIGEGLRLPRRASTGSGLGSSGVTGVVASMGGPPVAMLFVGEHPSVVRAEPGRHHSLGVLVSVGLVCWPTRSWTDVMMSLWLMPGLFGGLFVSRFFVGRVNAAGVARAVLFVCVVAGVALVL